MNKKLLALLLAILMVAMSAVAMADAQTSIKITKSYDSSIRPNETLTFTATLIQYKNANGQIVTGENAGQASITAATQAVSSADTGSYTEITFTPSVTETNFTKPGFYTFKVTESSENIQGETLNSSGLSEFTFDVLIGYNSATGALEVTDVQFTTKTDGSTAKVSGFTNKYEVSSFKLKKNVGGNQANVNDEFEVTITVTPADGKKLDSSFTAVSYNGTDVSYDATASTATSKVFKLQNVAVGTEYTIGKIPVGASVQVVETGYTGSDGIAYTPSYSTTALTLTEAGATNAPTITIAADGSAMVGIYNFRDTNIATGVTTDSMPYILLMAFVAILAVAFVAKKRTVKE